MLVLKCSSQECFEQNCDFFYRDISSRTVLTINCQAMRKLKYFQKDSYTGTVNNISGFFVNTGGLFDLHCSLLEYTGLLYASTGHDLSTFIEGKFVSYGKQLCCTLGGQVRNGRGADRGYKSSFLVRICYHNPS